MLKFTLDTNCIIDLDEGRPAALSIKRLITAHHGQKADLAIVASSASERQIDGGFLSNMMSFCERAERVGLGGLELLKPIGRYGVGFWDNCVWAGADAVAREAHIFSVLFPTCPIDWHKFAKSRNVAADDYSSPAYQRWRNRILDAQAFWAHDANARDVFVTSDVNFRRLSGHVAFNTARICAPTDAAALV